MNVTGAIDFEDSEGLLDADRDGLLRAASSAGAQVRAIVAAVDEGALEPVRADDRPRSVIWLAGRGTAETAGAILAATLGGSASQPFVLTGATPPWLGPLDLLVIAGDDPGDPALVAAAATAVRRGARIVVAAPYEGPLRDATAGRAAVLSPRLWIPDEFGLCRYLAAGMAVVRAVDPRPSIGLDDLADELDAEALRNSAGRELFTNPAKTLAARMTDRRVALAGDDPATVALARHGSSVLLRIAQQATAATGLADAVVALRTGFAGSSSSPAALFHDEELDGPLPQRLRVLALTLSADRAAAGARLAGFDDADVISADDVPDLPGADPATGAARARTGVRGVEQQLAILAVRLEMAAVYLRLARG